MSLNKLAVKESCQCNTNEKLFFSKDGSAQKSFNPVGFSCLFFFFLSFENRTSKQSWNTYWECCSIFNQNFFELLERVILRGEMDNELSCKKTNKNCCTTKIKKSNEAPSLRKFKAGVREESRRVFFTWPNLGGTQPLVRGGGTSWFWRPRGNSEFSSNCHTPVEWFDLIGFGGRGFFHSEDTFMTSVWHWPWTLPFRRDAP